MTYENKKRVRVELSKDPTWVVVDGILGEDISVLVWNKEVEIIYEDMDGQPCMCNAMCEKSQFSNAYFRAVNGPACGNRMGGVIAYRPVKEGK